MMKLRTQKKQEARRWARFWRDHYRLYDRHDRCGAPVGPPTFVRHEVTYEYVRNATLPENPPTIVMPSSGQGRWLRTEEASQRWRRRRSRRRLWAIG